MVTTNAETIVGRRTVIGVFDRLRHVEEVLTALRDAGFAAEPVSVVANDTPETRDVTERTARPRGRAPLAVRRSAG